MERDPRRRHAPPEDQRRPPVGVLRRARVPGDRHAHRQRGHQRDAQGPRGRAVVRPHAGALPRRRPPCGVVVKADDVTKPEVASRDPQLEARALGTKTAVDPTASTSPPTRPSRRSRSRSRARARTTPSDDRARDRARHVIPTVGTVRGVEAVGGGDSRRDQGQQRWSSAHAPIVFLFVLGMAFVILMVTFRSIVIPVKAIVLNLLSVARRLRRARRWSSSTVSATSCSASSRPVPSTAVAAAVPLRDPVRPVDGLPRVHPQPGP